MTYKALIIDLDGTTIGNGQFTRPTKRVIDAVVRAKKKVTVCAATGRPLSTARWIFNDLHLTSPSIISSGTKIIDPVTEHIFWQVRMDTATVATVLHIAAQFPYKTYADSQLDTYPPKKTYSLQEESVIYIVEIPIAQSSNIIARLQQIPSLRVTRIRAYNQTHLDIHITSPDGTKGNAISHLRKLLGIAKKDCIGIGDSYNDLSLFEEVGLKIAMGNASPELKERADYITSHVTQDGLAQAIEKFILDPASSA